MTGNAVTVAQALALHQQGRLAEAVPLYREVLTREPHNSDALHLLGLAVAALGDLEQDWLYDIMSHQFKSAIVQQMSDIVATPREKTIEADHIVIVIQ